MELAFLIIAFFAFVGGGAALLVGMAGHRVGTEPFCRKCNYNLTNLESPQCPECGVALTPQGILTGVHRRRPSAIFLGICILLFGVACIAGLATGLTKRMDIYRALPLNWLITRADAMDPRALAELNRRVKLPSLSPIDAHRIAAAALKHIPPKYPTGGPVLEWMFALDELYLAGSLSTKDGEKYLKSLAYIEPGARSVVRLNDPLPINYSIRVRESRIKNYGLETALLEDHIDGRPTEHGDASNTSYLNGLKSEGGLTTFISTATLTPGRHSIESKYRMRLVGLPAEITETFKFDVLLLPPDAADPIKLRTDPSIDAAISNSLLLDTLNWQTDPKGNKANLNVSFRVIRPIPIALAFDVIIRDGQHPEAHGSLTIPKDAPLNHGYGIHVDMDPDEPGPLTILLRPSRAIAAQSASIFDIWNGQLSFGPLDLTATKDWSGKPMLEYRYIPASK